MESYLPTCIAIDQWQGTCIAIDQWQGTCIAIDQWQGTCIAIEQWQGTYVTINHWQGTYCYIIQDMLGCSPPSISVIGGDAMRLIVFLRPVPEVNCVTKTILVQRVESLLMTHNVT